MSLYRELTDLGMTLGTHEGDPFVIVDSWETVAKANKIINETLFPDKWDEYEPVYRASHKIRGKSWSRPYEDLRLGTLNMSCYNDEWRLSNDPKLESWNTLKLYNSATPYLSSAPYLVPEGLLDLEDFLELMGVNWGFADEYAICDHCGNSIFRTEPDSYGWTPSFWHDKDTGEQICEECVENHFEDAYIEYCSTHLHPMTIIDPEDVGYIEIPITFEAGLYGGQNDDPQLIVDTINGPDVDPISILFTYQPSQFDTRFQVWVKPQDEDEALERLKQYKGLPYDPATEMKKALRGEHSDHVKVTRVEYT